MKSDIDTIELSELAQSYIDKNLSVNPEYQRGAAWSVKQQRALIDSVLKGFILPIFYVHCVKRMNPFTRSETVTAWLVDGQQRLNAITEFMRGRFALADAASGSSATSAYEKRSAPRWAGQRFDELSVEDRARFLKHPLSVVRMEEETPNEVRDLFIRLQSGTPLNPQEKRDAWPGNFTIFVIKHAGKDKHPASNPHSFFDLIKHAATKTGEGEESIYLDRRSNTRKFFAGLAMTYIVRQESELDFVDLKATTIDSFYQHKTDLTNDDPAVVGLLKLLSDVANLPEIHRIRDGNKVRFQWAFHLVFLVDSLVSAEYIDATWRSRIVDAFEEFRAKCANATKESKAGPRSRHYTEFVQLLSGSGSDTADNIRRRHRFLLLEIIDVLKPRPRDPQRIFGPVEREILWYRQGGKCAHPECQQPTALAEMHAHHIEEHSRGGATTLQNGVLVCRSCHENRADMQSLEPFFRKKVTEDLASAPTQLQNTDVEMDDAQPRKLRIAVDWPKLAKGDTVQVIHEPLETNTLLKFCAVLIDAYGANAIKWLTETPITRYVITKEPLVTFKNPVSGGAYSHRAIEKTGYFLCTHSSQEEKLKRFLSWLETLPSEVRAHIRATVE